MRNFPKPLPSVLPRIAVLPCNERCRKKNTAYNLPHGHTLHHILSITTTSNMYYQVKRTKYWRSKLKKSVRARLTGDTIKMPKSLTSRTYAILFSLLHGVVCCQVSNCSVTVENAILSLLQVKNGQCASTILSKPWMVCMYARRLSTLYHTTMLEIPCLLARSVCLPANSRPRLPRSSPEQICLTGVARSPGFLS